MRKAVFYARVSTEEEKQLKALPKQIEECEETISQKGWALVDRYVDEGKSGTQVKRRNEYQRLLSDMEGDKFDIIVVKSQDRLQRNTKDWYCFVDRLVQNNKKLYLYLDGKFFTPADDALITEIKAILAEEYSRDLSRKLNNSAQRRIEKVRNGENVTAMGTNQCYGYYIKDGKWVVDHEQAKIAKMAYELYLKYDSVRKVVSHLNEAGYRNQKGNKFCCDTITRILKNPRYKGTLVVNRFHRNFEKKCVDQLPPEEWVTLDNAFEAIVDAETWQKVNDRLAAKRNGRRGKKISRDPLGGKLRCAHCGWVMWRHMAGGYYSYYCSNRVSRGDAACIGSSISLIKLRSIYKDLSKDVVVNKAAVKKSMLEWLDKVKSSLQGSVDTEAAEKELERLKRKREKLLDAFLDEIIDKESYKKKCSEIDKAEGEIRKRLEPIEENEDIQDIERIIADIDYELDQWMGTEDFEENKIDFLLEHTKKITVSHDKYVIIEIDLFAGAILFVGKRFMLFVNKRMPLHHV